MNRRAFFAALFAPLLTKLLPAAKPTPLIFGEPGDWETVRHLNFFSQSDLGFRPGDELTILAGHLKGARFVVERVDYDHGYIVSVKPPRPQPQQIHGFNGKVFVNGKQLTDVKNVSITVRT